jgi:hypothetical protein
MSEAAGTPPAASVLATRIIPGARPRGACSSRRCLCRPGKPGRRPCHPTRKCAPKGVSASTPHPARHGLDRQAVLGRSRIENWVGAILAPPAALLLGYVTLRGPRTLHLDERGFVATSGLPWRPPLDVAWRDVEVFTTERPGDGPASVWYQLRPAASRLPRRYRWMRRLIETPDNGLPRPTVG